MEAAVTVAIALLLTWPVRARLWALATTVPPRYALFSVASLVILLAGHMISRGAATYPLTAWDMYTVSNPADPQFIDYIAALSSGREERLLMGRLFPAGGRHFRARVDSAAFAVERSQPGQNRQAIDHLDTMLAAVARSYNAQHHAQSVRVIRLWVGTVPAQKYRGPASISRRLLYEYQAR